MEKYVVSLRVAKQLKENGWNKEANFVYFAQTEYQDNLHLKDRIGFYEDTLKLAHRDEVVGLGKALSNGFEIVYEAPIAEEILEELPNTINEFDMTVIKGENEFLVGYYTYSNREPLEYKYAERGTRLPDVLALLWISLKQSNLLTN